MVEMMNEQELRAAVTDLAAEDEDFRAKLLSDPARAFEDAFSIPVPAGVTIQVHEETRSEFHLVLPRSARLSEEELASVLGGLGGGGHS